MDQGLWLPLACLTTGNAARHSLGGRTVPIHAFERVTTTDCLVDSESEGVDAGCGRDRGADNVVGKVP